MTQLNSFSSTRLKPNDLPDLSAEQMVAKIKADFPAIACQKTVINDEGWDHKILFVDDKYVFRFPRDSHYAKLLVDEIDLLAELKRFVKVRIPYYTLAPKNKSFAGYEIIRGKSLEPEEFAKLSDHDKTSFARQLAGFLSTLHTLTKKDLSFAALPQEYMGEDQADLKALTNKHLVKVLSQEDIARVYKIIEIIDDLLKQTRPMVFIHNDIYHSHLIWDAEEKQLGIIDFSDRSISDPAIDFGELFEYGDDFVQQVYETYTGPKDKTFLERAWKHQLWVGLFLMTDHFENPKTSFEEARMIFDRAKKGTKLADVKLSAL